MFVALLTGLLVSVAFIAIFTREVIAPASGATCDRRWQILATVLSISQAIAALAAGFLFERSFQGIALLQWADSLGVIGGGVAGFLLASLIAYGWHRATHHSDFLWRTVHQLHHSPQRIEAHTAFFAHPLDTFFATLITCASCYLVLGLDYRSAAVALVLASLFNLCIHADVRTPRWLGVLIQRPEMHRVHHQRGHHAGNYGLPLWDLLFGTWVNPKEYVRDCGFDQGRDRRIFDMLLGRDVHQRAAAGNPVSGELPTD